MADAEIVGGNERIKDLMISLLLTAVRKEVCRARRGPCRKDAGLDDRCKIVWT